MVTFAQAQERAEEWVNGDVPAYQHREVRVREFELGFVVWAEDRADGPTSDGGRQRLVIARDSGEATLWPGLPVGEVIRRYEEEYGTPDAGAAPAAAPPQRIDLNQTSFLLSPPEWLQDAADRLGIPDQRAGAGSSAGAGAVAAPAVQGAPDDGASAPAGAAQGSGWSQGAPGGSTAGRGSHVGGDAWPGSAAAAAAAAPHGSGGGSGWPAAGGRGDHEPTASDGVPATSGGPGGAAPWAGTDTNGASGDASVPLPATVFAPPLSGADDDDTPPPVGADAPTALMSGGSQLPPTAVAPAIGPQPGGAQASGPQPPVAPSASSVRSAPSVPGGPSAGDIADAATSKAGVPPRGRTPRGGGSTTPPPPAPPGVPGARPGAPGAPGTPGVPAGGYVPTQMVSQLGPDGPQLPGPPAPSDPQHQAATMLANPGPGGPGAPQPPQPPGPPAAPGAPGTPPGSAGGTPTGGVHHAATMLANPSQGGPGAPQPPGPPGAPGAPGTPPGSAGGIPTGGVHHAATMLAGPGQVPPAHAPAGAPGPVPPPHAPQPPAYGYPQQPPAGVPMVGPGYQAVLRYRAPDGSEQQLIRRSAPGTPHPEWQIFHELRGMNVPSDQVLELHTELESCELPGGYCSRMIRETWPQARITNIAPYGRDHASRQGGMQQLLTHQGELHQVADGPARPAPVRAPLPPVQPAPPVPPEGIAQELVGAFGPQGICRFDQRAVSRQGVPEIVALTLVWAGLPADFGPFFWAQPAQPVVPTLAELAAQRQVQPASDAGSYLVVGSDFGKAICVQYGTAQIVAVPVEGGPGGQPVAPQFVNSGLPEFTRCLALLGRMWRLRFGLNPEQAGRWTVDFQVQLAALDPAALSSPESWWSVLLEQMWDGLL
ncbi:SUKH-4 family immunity protein [Streptomyces sp. NPDC059909]|uniref:SUKH-4 family immunity protein n=1 Tax=Streptomyces sp. NPDC059909 TaxID=3346998 RepID=UPI00364A13F3